MKACEINRRFDLHRPATQADGNRCDEIREAIKRAARVVVDATPPNREQSLAVGKLEEALFFAIGAVVRPPAGE